MQRVRKNEQSQGNKRPMGLSFPKPPSTSFERFVEQLQLFLEDRIHFFYTYLHQTRAIRPRDGRPDNKT